MQRKLLTNFVPLNEAIAISIPPPPYRGSFPPPLEMDTSCEVKWGKYGYSLFFVSWSDQFGLDSIE